LFKQFLSLPFQFLDSIHQKLFLIAFSGLFSFIFLSIYNPFNLSEWAFYKLEKATFVFIAIAFLGMLIIGLSQFGLRHWFQLKTLTIFRFLLLFSFEFSALTTANYFLFGDLPSHLNEIIKEILLIAKQTGLILGLNYCFSLLILSLWHFKKENQKIREKINHSNISNTQKNIQQIHIKDENDKVMISLKPNKIVFFKSEANYITVYYLVNNQIKKSLVRSNLKKMEADILDHRFMRIHRSYMINTEHILSIHRNKRSYALILTALPKMEIPVSSSYKSIFEEKVKIS
jgi:hypothetical protein